jgi:hypothetical protein
MNGCACKPDARTHPTDIPRTRSISRFLNLTPMTTPNAAAIYAKQSLGSDALLERSEEILVHDRDLLNSKPIVPKEFDQSLTVDEIDRLVAR